MVFCITSLWVVLFLSTMVILSYEKFIQNKSFLVFYSWEFPSATSLSVVMVSYCGYKWIIILVILLCFIL